MKELTPEAIIINCIIILFIMIYERSFFLHALLKSGTACLIQLLMLALLMHLKHGYISFGSTKQLNLILQPI